MSERRAAFGAGPCGVVLSTLTGRGTTNGGGWGTPGFTDATPLGCECVLRSAILVTGQIPTDASCICPQ